MQHIAKRARVLIHESSALPSSLCTRCYASDSSSASKYTPPLLPRPLGVKDPPSSIKLSKEELKSRFLDSERVQQQRKAIKKELSKSYFQDFGEISKTGGKLWMAPETVIKAERSLFFPAMEGISLANKEQRNTADMLKGKVSTVSIINTKISSEQVNTFLPSVIADHGSNPYFQAVQINLQENAVKSWLLSLFLSSLRKEVPEELQATYLLSHQNMELLNEPLGIANQHVGYVYLVDWKNRIRWAAVGFADASGKELESLRSCTSVLLDRLKEGKES